MLQPILYSFRRCPYAMRARLGIADAGQSVALREVVLRDKPAEMLAVSPKGTVPVMVMPDGVVIEQSFEIMEWAYEESLDEKSLALVARNDGPFKQALDRYKYADRYPEFSQQHYREQGEEFLAELEGLLSPNLSGADMGFVDYAIVPFVRQFAGVDEDWFASAPYPRVRDWLTRFVNSELFENVMGKYPQWLAGDREPIFP